MLDKLIDMIFGCWHTSYSFPITNGKTTYVVCLDCGKEFEYDWAKMKVGGKLSEQLTENLTRLSASYRAR